MLVSICIPTYQDVEGVTRLLKSIEIQSSRDFEVIITDDTRDDCIRNIVAQFSGSFNVTYIKNKRRLGPTANCNAAIKAAQGKYIKLMHQDDWFSYSDSLQKMSDMLEFNMECDLAFSGTCQVKKDDKKARTIQRKHLYKIQKDYRYLFVGNFIGAPSATIFRKKAFFDEKLTWLVDMELYMRILEKNNNLVNSDNPLISIGISDNQLTNSCTENWKLQMKEYFYIFCKYKLYKSVAYILQLIKIYLIITKNIVKKICIKD